MSKDELIQLLHKANDAIVSYSNQFCIGLGDVVSRKCAKTINGISTKIIEIIENIETIGDATEDEIVETESSIDLFSSSTKVESRQELQAVNIAIFLVVQ